MKTIAITGASGFLGRALATELSKSAKIFRFVRREASSDTEIPWDPAKGTIDKKRLEGLHAIVHLAGESIADGRWTEARKREILESRTQGTALIAKTIAELKSPPSVLISGSAIGVYGDQGDQILDETTPPGTGFLADVCKQWETATAPCESKCRVVKIRTGIVLHPDGGALKQMLPPFKMAVGGRLGSGRQWMSWIARHDEVRAIQFLLASDIKGAVNLVAPNPVTNASFTEALGHALKRPAIFPVPAFMVRALFGEMGDALLIGSQRVLPRVLVNAGFEFTQPKLDACLSSIL